MSKYVTQRYMFKCCQTECKRLGRASTGGLHVCWHHEPGATSRRSRSRSRDRRGREDAGDVQERDTEPVQAPPEVPEPQLQRLLDELKDLKESFAP